MSTITFLNSPPLRDWMSDGEKEFRSQTREYITSAISENTIFTDKEISVSFFQTGVASIVALLEQGGKKFVIKTCFKPERSQTEAAAFIQWNKSGIKTPTVLAQGKIDQHTYFIMEYLDFPTIKEVIEKDPTKKLQYYSEMGHLLYKIHSIPIQGFGQLQIKNEIASGKYATLIEAITVEINNELREALDVLNTVPQKNTVIGHFDFSPNHVFATEPITIFDPDPEATLPIIDLAFFCLLPRSIEDSEIAEMRKMVIKAYTQDSGPLDPNILAAAVVFKVHEKAHALRLLPSPEREKRAQNMLDKAGSMAKATEYIRPYLN